MDGVTFNEDDGTSPLPRPSVKRKRPTFEEMLVAARIAKTPKEAGFYLVGAAVFVFIVSGIILVGAATPHRTVYPPPYDH